MAIPEEEPAKTRPSYPDNSNSAKKAPNEPPKMEVIAKAETRKKSTGRRLLSAFKGEDSQTVKEYVIFDVLVPAAKQTLSDMVSQGFERLLFGESSRRRPGGPASGPSGFTNYTKFATPTGPVMSPSNRATHNFQDILLTDRGVAQMVLDGLVEYQQRYGVVTVADLYDATEITSTHADRKWGWTNLSRAGIVRVQGGYLLDLPQPEQIK